MKRIHSSPTKPSYWLLAVLIGIPCLIVALVKPVSAQEATATPTQTPAPTPTTPVVTVTPSPTGPTTTPSPTATQTPTPTPTGCANAAPKAPVVTAASSGAHAITLSWPKATDTVTHYVLSYGVKSNSYIYGDPNFGGQNTTSYTVGNLATGKTYYFVVRPWNGCASGALSYEVSAVAGGTTPTTVPTDKYETPDATPTESVEAAPTDTPTSTPTAAPQTSGGGISPRTVAMGIVGLGMLFLAIPIVLAVREKLKKPSAQHTDSQLPHTPPTRPVPPAEDPQWEDGQTQNGY